MTAKQNRDRVRAYRKQQRVKAWRLFWDASDFVHQGFAEWAADHYMTPRPLTTKGKR